MPDEKKRRVGKACDICRIKKIKCNGKKPCDKCLLDNRVCTFLERRRDRDKHYPPGYLELMETRNALLTKLLVRLVQLSVRGEDMGRFFTEKHPVLELHPVGTESAADADAVVQVSDGLATSILINKVLDLLVNDEGLLAGEPVEWEEGTLIALGFSSANADSAAKAFAEHTKKKRDSNESIIKEEESFQIPAMCQAPSMTTDGSTFNLLSPVLLLSDDKLHESLFPIFLDEKNEPTFLPGSVFDKEQLIYSDLTGGIAKQGDLEWERLFEIF